MTERHGIAKRLRWARQRFGWTQDRLAEASGVGVATVRRAEGAYFDPKLETARKLADALRVRVEWLLTGDEPMTMLAGMTVAEQHRAQTGPGTEGLPGYVVIDGGVWYRDERGEWHVDRDAIERKDR